MDDLLADFVAETREMLEASEGEIIAWEADPSDRARLDTIFRFVHTVKGNCGFFDFPRLEKLSHGAEDALSEVRAGRRTADSALVTAVLAIIDRIALMVDAIEAGEEFAEGGDDELIAALDSVEDAIESSPVEAVDAVKTDKPKADSSNGVARTIRLPVELLDRVMSGVSDMVLARNDLAHRLREAGTEPTIDGPFERMTTILNDVREAATRMRMQRIEHLFGAFPRLVRDLSAELGKQVMIDLEGGSVELDREMIEMIRDPMTHIIRNAVDHGIETPSARLKDGKREIGILSIAARQAGDKIWIVVGDDGQGLDEKRIGAKAVANGLITAAQLATMSREEVLQFIFEPGLSTAEQVNAISGRGVGLDVVRANLEKIGGTISVNSTPGEGTMFILKIPLTLSIIAGLTVRVGDQRFAIAQSFVEEIVHASTDSIEFSHAGSTQLVTFRERRTPCLALNDVLKIDPGSEQDKQVLVFVRLASGDVFALRVDGIHNYGDLVVKPLPPSLMQLGIYAGSTLLDDGQPILMLDVPTIASQHGLLSDARARVPQAEEVEKQNEEDVEKATRAMMFVAHGGRRQAVGLELVQRIETITGEAIDRSAEAARVIIDGEILPLLGLPDGELPEGRMRLLRLSDGSSEVLYSVREVLDAVDLDQEMVDVDDGSLVGAVTLVDGGPVDVLNCHELFARHGAIPKRTAALTCRLPKGEWSRRILEPLLTSAGYRVTSQADAEVDVAILLDENAESAAKAASGVIRLRSQPDDQASENEREEAIYRYDRDGLLSALRQFGKGEVA